VTQQRQFPRYALEAAVTLTLGDRVVRGRASNLSRGGASVMMEEAIAVGERVAIEMALVFDNDSLSEPLSLVGRVVWCTAVAKKNEQTHQVGLSFVGLKGEQTKYLDIFLKYLKEGGA
jgi:Tfp pilus assembly protein PilZ